MALLLMLLKRGPHKASDKIMLQVHHDFVQAPTGPERWRTDLGALLIAGDVVFAPSVEVAGAALTGAAFAWLGWALLRGAEERRVGAASPRPA